MKTIRKKIIDLLDEFPVQMEWHDNADLANFLLSHGVTVQGWIPVEERLPEKDVRVLIWMQDNEEGYTQMDTDRWSCTMEQGYHWIRWGKSVTHWMPLPQPPKGE